jgi:hypothetical protein
MSHYALLGDYRFGNAAEDIRGAALYGFDDKGQGNEKLGKIQDVDRSQHHAHYAADGGQSQFGSGIGQ